MISAWNPVNSFEYKLKDCLYYLNSAFHSSVQVTMETFFFKSVCHLKPVRRCVFTSAELTAMRPDRRRHRVCRYSLANMTYLSSSNHAAIVHCRAAAGGCDTDY